MSGAWLREEQVDLAVDRLLDAAGEAFAHDGVDATTMAGVALVAGCSRATLYTCLPNRRALHVAFVNRATPGRRRRADEQLQALSMPSRLVEGVLLSWWVRCGRARAGGVVPPPGRGHRHRAQPPLGGARRHHRRLHGRPRAGRRVGWRSRGSARSPTCGPGPAGWCGWWCRCCRCRRPTPPRSGPSWSRCVVPSAARPRRAASPAVGVGAGGTRRGTRTCESR